MFKVHVLFQTIPASVALATQRTKVDTGHMLRFYMSERVGFLFVAVGAVCAFPNMFIKLISTRPHF
jgi:uncharacterized membrane protein (UPF0127 family)